MSTIPNANASIYADVDKRTVTGINDGLEKVFVTKNGITYSFSNAKAGTPPGTKGMARSKKLTVQMNKKGASYYSDQWRLQRSYKQAAARKVA